MYVAVLCFVISSLVAESESCSGSWCSSFCPHPNMKTSASSPSSMQLQQVATLRECARAAHKSKATAASFNDVGRICVMQLLPVRELEEDVGWTTILHCGFTVEDEDGSAPGVRRLGLGKELRAEILATLGGVAQAEDDEDELLWSTWMRSRQAAVPDSYASWVNIPAVTANATQNANQNPTNNDRSSGKWDLWSFWSRRWG